jgi:transposase
MMNITTIGIDLAKNVFHVHGVDERGKVVVQKRLARRRVSEFMFNLPPCRVGIESCSGAHYWHRIFRSYGHDVGIMSPQFVKPYVKSNKNDRNDAEGICEAVSRPNMRFVMPKAVEQQDIQCVHRIRQRLVGQRTSLVNQVRGLLAEYGIVLPQGIRQLRRRLPELLEDAGNELTALGRELFAELYEELRYLDERIAGLEVRIRRLFNQSERCRQVGRVEGIGPITATALVAAVGDAHEFHDGREMAAWLGLVPRQRSTGGHAQLLGISKRGDRYLRTLLIHGARAVVRVADRKQDARSRWITRLKARRGKNIAAVALANKNARVVWALLSRAESYQPTA